MTSDGGMKISWVGMCGWVLSAGVLAGAIGAWPTHRIAGAAGLRSLLTVGCVVVLAALLSGAVIRRHAARGPGRAAFAFILVSLPKAVVCLGATLGAKALFALPVRPVLAWLVIFYFVTLAAECAWLARALQKDAFRVALGEVRRDNPFTPEDTRPRNGRQWSE